MSESVPSFFTRLAIAFGAFFDILSDARLAGAVRALRERKEPSQPSAKGATRAEAPAFAEAQPDAALQLLGLLQQEGRLLDFLEEDVAHFPDAEVGAAARVIHQGCRKAIRDHFTIAPVRTEPEGARVTLDEGFDASSIRLTGNVTGRPPFTGNLIHRGWRVTEVRLPRVARGHDTRIVAAAEVEL